MELMRSLKDSMKPKCVVVANKPHWRFVGFIKKCYGDEEKSYVAFLGIPYAMKPVGLKRYQAPESWPCPEAAQLKRGSTTIPPIASGEGSSSQPTESGRRSKSLPPEALRTYKANVTGKMCAQLASPFKRGSSDCLYLNIFLPKDPKDIEELLPVLVYIHGGGFIHGSNDHKEITPDLIVQYGVVFVTINYRLGLFGFLNTHAEDCPGNAGLKDQVKALEWIRDNIEHFKGDPHNVTLSGFSAGATCVNMHLIAPASKDLFHKAIVHSGGVFCTWGFRGRHHEQSRLFLKNLKFRKLLFAEKESAALQKCACRLLKSERQTRHPESFSPFFGPSVEDFRDEAFIPEDIKEMMKKVEHDKPVMAGITKDEGIIPFLFVPGTHYTRVIDNDVRFRNLVMDNFRWSYTTATKYYEEIRNLYFPKRFYYTHQEKVSRCANLYRDIFFRKFYQNFKFGPEKAVHPNLYVYQFDHVSEISLVNRSKFSMSSDATHGDDITYLYCPYDVRRRFKHFIYQGPYQNKSIQKVMNHMASLWANFCKTGIPKSDFAPRVDWRRHTEENPCYLSIDEDLKLKQGSLFQKEWARLNKSVKGKPKVRSLDPTPLLTKPRK